MFIAQYGKNKKLVSADGGFGWMMTLRKLVALAAGMLMPVVLFMFLSPIVWVPKARRGLGPSYKALEKVENIHIAEHVCGEIHPIRQTWISRTLNIHMTRTEDEQLVLLDINNCIAKKKQLGTGPVKTMNLTKNMLTNTEKAIAGYFGMMPFPDISDIPEDAQWQEVPDASFEMHLTNVQVYDLIWAEKESDGSIAGKKWRGYIEVNTRLPHKIKLYQKPAADRGYTFDRALIARYPPTTEIQTVINNFGF